jgi:hypothetical protein
MTNSSTAYFLSSTHVIPATYAKDVRLETEPGNQAVNTGQVFATRTYL